MWSIFILWFRFLIYFGTDESGLLSACSMFVRLKLFIFKNNFRILFLYFKRSDVFYMYLDYIESSSDIHNKNALSWIMRCQPTGYITLTYIDSLINIWKIFHSLKFKTKVFSYFSKTILMPYKIKNSLRYLIKQLINTFPYGTNSVRLEFAHLMVMFF